MTASDATGTPAPGGAPRSVDPRRQLALESRAPRRSAFSALLSALESFRERTGNAVGGAYALAARSILTRVERLEDLNAERRHAQRSQPAEPARPDAAAAPRPAQSLPPPLK